MAGALFSVPNVNVAHAAIEGNADLPDGSHLLWALSRKEFGPMSYKNRPEWDVAANRLQFLRLWQLKLDQLVAPFLGHTNNVQVVTSADMRKGAREASTALQDTDALLTRDPNVILMTTHADCLPVWLAAPESGWIGIAHVGWRGLLAGIVRNFIEAVPAEHRGDLHLAVGPGISAPNYEVGDDVADKFRAEARYADVVVEMDGSPHLDLVAGVQADAAEFDIPVSTQASICTYDNDYLSSYRRDGDSFAPMAAFIVRLGGR